MTIIISGSDGVSDVDGSAATPAIRGTDTNTATAYNAGSLRLLVKLGANGASEDIGDISVACFR